MDFVCGICRRDAAIASNVLGACEDCVKRRHNLTAAMNCSLVDHHKELRRDLIRVLLKACDDYHEVSFLPREVENNGRCISCTLKHADGPKARTPWVRYGKAFDHALEIRK